MEFGSFKVTGPRVRMRRRAELGRRLTRRLSIVARMPAAILSRANPPEPRQVEITAIAPDKTQLMPEKARRAIVKVRRHAYTFSTGVDVKKVLPRQGPSSYAVQTSAAHYAAVADTDRRYRATEKLLHAEEEYREALCSAKELYARPLAQRYPEFHDVIFQPIADLSRVSAEHCQRIRRALENWDSGAFKSSDLFPGSFWNSYWEYLVRYSEARRTLDELRATEDPLLEFLNLKQAAARHSPLSLLLLPNINQYGNDLFPLVTCDDSYA
ncbi:hypothetical protein DMN91_008915 [Ooceraea biroi]|uniref:DH domain-containing protein n=1 Tax=Ooceraea biroi TaxID=2015173 RepID=A0A3L8DF65_OOCBI|nr:hypothetical protein DMN91_008915 [Ooceraea biroi]